MNSNETRSKNHNGQTAMMNANEAREFFVGPLPSVRTPFSRDGSVDYKGLGNIVDFCAQTGAKILILTPGDSHYVCLSDEEIGEVTRVVCQHAKGRIKVIASDHHYSTDRAVAFAKYAKEVGADFIMPEPPDWAGSATMDLLVDHLEAASEVLPLVFITALTGRSDDFHIELARKLRDRTDKFVAIKDDRTGKFGQRICLELADRVAVFAGGQKINHMNIWPFGASGYFSTFMTFFPEVAHQYWKAVETGNLKEAVRIIREVDAPFFAHTMSYPGIFDAAIHGIMEIHGITTRWRRKPYHSLNDAEMEKLGDYLRSAKLL
jgi:4-hydroxy-tetrahydrodipicolinate synthase